ncbi:MAG TPA: extracellular solute-binding protein [Gemmatales bacterium]|nr:extracellular solute-binding protein [Gemmatales bacterium]
MFNHLPVLTRFVCLGCLLLLVGCQSRANERVVLYCSQDREYAEGILEDFTRKTGIQIDFRGDTESNKSISLYEALVREAPQPRCDVFWCNEPVLMQRLAQRGVLEAYQSPSAANFPEWTRPKDKEWQAFAARARILLVNNRINDTEVPKSLNELASSKWSTRWAMAKPFFGTTATHAACLWQQMGKEAAQQLLGQMAKGAVILPGNHDVAVAVAEGQVDMGLTDTDDAMEVIAKKFPVRIVYLDQPTPGTLFLPNTLGLIKNASHPVVAKKLIDYLLTVEVEERLAKGPSAQIPLNPKAQVSELRIKTPNEIKAMNVDYDAVARSWEEVQAYLRSTFRE